MTPSYAPRPWRRPTPVGRTVRWLGSRSVRSVLGLLALALVLSAFGTGYLRHRAGQQFAAQQAPPDVPLSAAEVSAFRAAATTPPDVGTAPIVLAYHDIAERPRDRHEISPEAFARQMAMLQEAGYRTLTGDEFVAILRGGPSPPRSVLLTFDDGTQGLWTHADQILARYGFHAVAFLITGQLSDQAGPYYLSWPEVRRMAESGRWTFGSHTRDSHREVAVSSTGPPRSDLVNRRWTADGREQLAAFQRRVDDDLRGSIDDLTGHGLPRPRLFAYPFSEASLPAQDPQALHYVVGRVAESFDAAFSSHSATPEPVNERTRSRRPLIADRLPVEGSTSASELFAATQRMRTMPVAGAELLGPDAVWVAPDGSEVPVRTDGGRLTVESAGTYLETHHAPQATGDWTGYRISATARGLAQSRAVAATLVARVGSSETVTVRISATQVRVSSGGKAMATRLEVSDSHAVTIDVSENRTVVTVDGITRDDRATLQSAAARGGVGLAVFRAGEASLFPVLEGVRVTSIARR